MSDDIHDEETAATRLALALKRLRSRLREESGGNPRTLEEVGQKFGVTRERIRQIEAQTLVKLKAYREAQCLHEFLD